MGHKYGQTKENLELLKKESVILGYMLSEPNKVYTKSELMAITGYNERKVRAEMERIANFYPVRASAGHKGYSIIWFDENSTIDELKIANNAATEQINEIQNRIECMKARLKPLIALCKVTYNKIQDKEKNESVK